VADIGEEKPFVDGDVGSILVGGGVTPQVLPRP
jgi:hypothetical protein